MLLLFSFIFIVALWNLKRQKSIFNLGLPYAVEDILVMVLSFVAVIQVLVTLARIEHLRELKERL